MLLGAAPFGLVFGAAAGPSGLSAGATLGMSLCVFAGSAQFIALTLVGGGAGLGVIVLTTCIVNLRHALYSATLLPYVARLPLRWRIPLAFWLTDETFAVVQNRLVRDGAEGRRYGSAGASADDGENRPVRDAVLRSRPGPEHWYYLGSALAMYGNWFAWTLAGMLVGSAIPDVEHLGLEFAMVATFIAMVTPSLANRPTLAASLAAGTVAVLLRSLPWKLGLVIAALSGVAAGMAAERLAPAGTKTGGHGKTSP